MNDNEIDLSDIPPIDENLWTKGELKLPRNKIALSVRIDEDVLEWFKSLGKGYQTKINAVLRKYMETNKSA